MVLSPASRYLEKEDEEAFRVVLAIREQTKLAEISLIRDFDLPKVTDLQAQFDFLPDITGTQDLEDQIDIKLQTDYDKHADDAFFPKFKLPSEQQPGQRLIWEAYIGLATRLMPGTKTKQDWQQEYPYNKRLELKEFVAQITPDTSKLLGYPSSYWKEKSVKDYIDRVEYELEIIIQKGYSEYFLVFGDIMGFCRENGIVTNTRGSAAGSLVGYLTNINVLDPLIYDIPFERFLNPFRPSPPDIDGDFADDKRDLVINYIRDRYGDTKVSQIITFGTMLPRAAVRDVGRVLGISYKKCDRLSKLIPIAPQGKKTTFDFAFETSDEVREVYEKDEESRRIVDISRKIEGNYRHASSHAAGLLITPTELTDYAPLQWDSEHKMLVSQYDMKVCEKVGLVKLDILGITNLAILGNAIALTEQRRKIDIDILNIDVSDPKAFELLASGRTMGTFQLSGGAMTRYLVDLRPTRVEDLMAMVALYRPGPMANIPEFIKRKRNPKLAKYFVPKMKDWMEPTFGILVYQEDLLLTAIEVAGYDWGEADVLRKGMGKKIQAVIEGQHPKFVEGCISHGGLSREKAEEIWQAFLPFAAYGFNKAHSASYGMVAYWTAYMKAEYTVEFMTAYMTSESNNLDKIAAAIAECRELGVEVLPPDVNNSYDNFSIENDQIIRYGLKSVKNLGVDLIDYIISERNQSGKFDNIENFLERVGVRGLLTKRNVEALILSGALDSLGAKVLQES
jgi:DNA polymerase-3 subunit alpha